jgi:chromosome segregation ATPase
VSLKTLPQEGSPANVRLPQNSTNGDLWTAQERLWQNEHQSAEQTVALVERDQRISALRAECDWLSSQLEEERKRRQELEPDLDLARSGWAAAEKRASEYEAGYHQTSVRLQQAEISVGELTGQVEVLKTERGEIASDLARHLETIAELNQQLNQARAERTEATQILGRARTELERTTAELAAAESVAEQSTAEVGHLKAAATNLGAELGSATAERDRLLALVREDHDLAEYGELKTAHERLETELRETQVRHDGFREKIDTLMAERDSLRHQRTDLQLKVAALRDAHDDTQLQQDNEILRRMVERLNEELKEADPEHARRSKRHARAGGIVGNLARSIAARCIVPDADVAEGQ